MAYERKHLPPGISLRKDGRYQARYTYNGKRITIYDKDLKELQKKLRDAKYEMEHGIYAKPDRITVDSWFKLWTKEYRLNVVRDTTVRLNTVCYNYNVKPEIGRMKLQNVRPEHLQKILNKMKNAGQSRSYIESTRQTMNLLFRQAFMNGIITTNPVERTVLPKVENEIDNPGRRALTEWEQRTFLDYVAKRSPFYADVFYVGFSTGMRVGEITALEWQDIDFDKLEIHVNGTMKKVTGVEYYKGPLKTAQSKRLLPLLPEVARRLKKHKVDQAKLRMMMGERWNPVKGLEHLVFTSKYGRPLVAQDIKKYIESTVKEYNAAEEKQAREENRKPETLERFCPHAMRHTFATRALEKGIPPSVVQAYLGHATVEMTMNIYTHVTAELEREEIKKLANQF